MIRKKLGCTIEEALALVERGRAAPAAGAPGTQQSGAGPTTSERKAQEELADAERRIKKLQKKVKRVRASKSAEMTRLEMQHEALAAGIPDQYTRFALGVYNDLWDTYSANPASVPPEIKAAFDKEEIDGKAVFRYIRATHMPAAAGQPGAEQVVDLSLSTSPPASRNPGETTPTPKPPGGAPTQFDANKLSDADWRKHKRSMGLGV